MEAITENYDENLVAWLPDGKSFVVVDPPRFVDDVLSNTFKGGKYTSFIRKLNRWGFTRLISGTGMDCFYHALFQRDRPDLCELITSGNANDDALGVDPDLLGDKPSLAGIEKFFRSKGKLKSDDDTQEVNTASEVNAPDETQEETKK